MYVDYSLWTNITFHLIEFWLLLFPIALSFKDILIISLDFFIILFFVLIAHGVWWIIRVGILIIHSSASLPYFFVIFLNNGNLLFFYLWGQLLLRLDMFLGN